MQINFNLLLLFFFLQFSDQENFTWQILALFFNKKKEKNASKYFIEIEDNW